MPELPSSDGLDPSEGLLWKNPRLLPPNLPRGSRHDRAAQ